MVRSCLLCRGLDRARHGVLTDLEFIERYMIHITTGKVLVLANVEVYAFSIIRFCFTFLCTKLDKSN